MKQWKVIIEQDNKKKEIILFGERYSDIYIKTSLEYPECIIISISEIRI